MQQLQAKPHANTAQPPAADIARQQSLRVRWLWQAPFQVSVSVVLTTAKTGGTRDKKPDGFLGHIGF